MSKDTTLHILNGEGTASPFRQSGIEGDIAVWNEALSSGPLSRKFASVDFWTEREMFLNGEYVATLSQPLADMPEYRKIVVSEFDKIRKFGNYTEVVLWFENDLFCQINLIGLLHWFSHQELSGTKLSIVCTDHHPNYDVFRGYGYLAPEDFGILQLEAKPITEEQLKLADEVWGKYTSSNPSDIVDVCSNRERYQLGFIPETLQHHAQRFPSVTNGLGNPEKRILKLIDKGGYTNLMVVKEMLETSDHYGFGDLEYFYLLQYLSPLYNKQDKLLILNEAGTQVLNGDINFQRINTQDFMLGGISNTALERKNSELSLS